MTQNPAYTQPVPARTSSGSGMATASLVLGIIAAVSSFTVFGGIILGLLAVIFGIIAVRRAGRGEATGRGRAVAGIVTGVLGIVLAGALIAFGVSVLNSPAGKNLRSCLQAAHNDSAAVQQCNQQYKNQVGN
ncbi:MAG: DUF4190 domain-containing protein [Actinomycetota bacterium]|nr:DUF4190 domain-containing protein [Actinomycetota bacterium]MDQ2956112.1 DUF4190 domain-containing protein [Actinomycetota bacterium]